MQSRAAWAQHPGRSTYELPGDARNMLAVVIWTLMAFIIDGGANIGIASLYFLNQCIAHIVAVEPSPASFRDLAQKSCPLRGTVTLIQGAIWKSRGSVSSWNWGGREWRTSVRDEAIGRLFVGRLPCQRSSLMATEQSICSRWCRGQRERSLRAEAQPAFLLSGIRHSDRGAQQVVRGPLFGALAGYRFDQLKHHKDHVIICRNVVLPQLHLSSCPFSVILDRTSRVQSSDENQKAMLPHRAGKTQVSAD